MMDETYNGGNNDLPGGLEHNRSSSSPVSLSEHTADFPNQIHSIGSYVSASKNAVLHSPIDPHHWKLQLYDSLSVLIDGTIEVEARA